MENASACPAVRPSMIFPRINGGIRDVTTAPHTETAIPRESHLWFPAVRKITDFTCSLFFILVFLIKVPQYTASHTPFIISFCFFITGRLLLESNLNRMIQREKKLIKSLGFAATGILIEKPGGDAVNFIIRVYIE